jgi:hypothetical protein
MNVVFDAMTRCLQIKGGAIAVTKDDRVYLVRGGRAVELVAVADDDTPPPEPMRYAPGELSGDTGD